MAVGGIGFLRTYHFGELPRGGHGLVVSKREDGLVVDGWLEDGGVQRSGRGRLELGGCIFDLVPILAAHAGHDVAGGAAEP